MKQLYENYTAEDRQVWKILYERQFKNLPDRATREFLDGLERIHFSGDEIPHFEKVNTLLQDFTGWTLQAVPGIVPDKDFFELLAKKKFPATTWLREMKQLDYIEEPDMFHDVFAHVPLLSNQPLVDFLESLSRIALKHIDDPWAVELVSRIYWFTVEFGLIRENDALRIYGAGILSSTGETIFCLSDEAEKRAYDVLEILRESYIKEKFQAKYFVLNSYEQLFDSVNEIDRLLEKELNGTQRVEWEREAQRKLVLLKK